MGKKKRRRETILTIGLTVIIVGVYATLQQWPVKDFFRGLWYQPSDKALAIAQSLDLTNTGQHILTATQPAMETSTSFNYHCDSHRAEISLLGCYTNGKIYVYEITRPELVDSNKVTMAHELLHAVWERLGNGEKIKLIQLLRQVEQENLEWFAAELAPYDDETRLEEIYTRSGTKLRELPAELEAHYAKYFNNRDKIIDYYENYQAPFLKLQAENQELETQILATKAEIIAERAAYLVAEANLERQIDNFNTCANQTGCFSSRTAFETERENILTEQEKLESTRIKLNDKIDENNARVELLRENQFALGELNNAMNSNIEESI